MKKKIKKYKSFYLYVVAAGSGVLVQYFVGSFLIRYWHYDFQDAVTWGFIASIPVGFLLSKVLAFDSRGSGNTQREMIKFIAVTFFSGLITVKGSYLTLLGLTNIFGNPKLTIPIINYSFSPIGTFSHFAGMGMSFVFNFFTHKKFTFVETGLYDKMKSTRKQNQ